MPAMESGWSGPTAVARVLVVALQARRIGNLHFEQPDVRGARYDFARDAEFPLARAVSRRKIESRTRVEGNRGGSRVQE